MKYTIFISLLILTPIVAYGQVQVFQTLPGLENVSNLSTQQYIDALYVIAITAASILVVVKLIWAGVQYMLSEVVTNKQKAKDDIKGALLGLLIILAAVTLLNTINPNLTELNFFRNAPSIVPRSGGGNAETKPPPRDLCPEGQRTSCYLNDVGTQDCMCVSK